MKIKFTQSIFALSLMVAINPASAKKLTLKDLPTDIIQYVIAPQMNPGDMKSLGLSGAADPADMNKALDQKIKDEYPMLIKRYPKDVVKRRQEYVDLYKEAKNLRYAGALPINQKYIPFFRYLYKGGKSFAIGKSDKKFKAKYYKNFFEKDLGKSELGYLKINFNKISNASLEKMDFSKGKLKELDISSIALSKDQNKILAKKLENTSIKEVIVKFHDENLLEEFINMLPKNIKRVDVKGVVDINDLVQVDEKYPNVTVSNFRY